MKEIVRTSAAIATVIGVAIAAFQLGSSKNTNQSPETKQEVKFVLEQSFNSLSQERKIIAEQLIPVIEEIMGSVGIKNKAERGKIIEEAGIRFTRIVKNIPITSYDAKESPVLLIENKAVMICNRTFSLAYVGQSNVEKYPQQIYLKVNGKPHSFNPGDMAQHATLKSKVKLRYLEYQEQSSEPVIMFECST